MSDAGPLMALGVLDRLDLLARLFLRTLVPEAVLAECVARPDLADARAIRAAVDRGAFEVLAVEPVAHALLGVGERSAIALAQVFPTRVGMNREGAHSRTSTKYPPLAWG